MNAENLRAELENDLAWRLDEIRFFSNTGQALSDVSKKDQYRRALVVMLYAHLEGFCKFAFSAYANAVNGAQIRCGDANYAIAAASLADLFEALHNSEGKCQEFKNALPEDRKLHRFAREREFLQSTVEFENRVARIPDGVVDMESNLNPNTLRKNLFRLGFKHDQFKDLDGDVSRLASWRHAIAHGRARAGVKATEYASLFEAATKVMREVSREIASAAQEGSYLRPRAQA